MGGKKKKSSGGVVKKDSKYKIPSAFDCPMCDAKAAIRVKMIKAEGKALVSCRVCHTPDPAFACQMTRLSKPHDAFFAYYEQLVTNDHKSLIRNNVQLEPSDESRVRNPTQQGTQEQETGEVVNARKRMREEDEMLLQDEEGEIA